MSTRIFGLLLSVRNCYASMKMATEPTLLLQRWSEGRQSLPRSEENIISLLSLSTPGRLNHLLSNRIQTLPWGFSARPSLLLLISICSVLESKFRLLQSFVRKNFSQLNFRILEFYAKYAKFCTIQKIPAIRYFPLLVIGQASRIFSSTDFADCWQLQVFGVDIN